MAVIYARCNGRNDTIIRQREIRTVQPLQLSSYLDPIVREPAAARQFLEEMQVNLREHPSSFRARFVMGIFALKRGPAFLAEAVQEFQQAIALNPEFIPAYINLGSIYMHLGRRSEARQVYEQVLARGKNATAEEQLRLLSR
jgi:tetratricopeptide (TPR) repeat protein